jgi:D-glycero-D-manno-heptose 1,7-bisphosphate phosphatase
LGETHLLDDVAEALDILRAAGFSLAVVSNQPDVARGTQQMEVVESINASLAARLSLDCFEVCYHDSAEGCACRKPKPGLILRAAEKIGADLEQSFVIGDRWRDIDAGEAAGCSTVWIDRGYSERQPLNHTFRATSLLEAALWIVQQPSPEPAK